ncbi:Enhancer of polycomb-like protein 1 [Sphaceloma murrayae]|uniref:Enhancer of polycomb-like protein 1 n=1 Tax=Sphaceloma murrayae TaxID=2082308 RepID=A0A2K1QIM7_9PEZI|nr:Enhancer of polycomb-like protein 1 [Sphaceloma murrayae]
MSGAPVSPQKRTVQYSTPQYQASRQAELMLVIFHPDHTTPTTCHPLMAIKFSPAALRLVTRPPFLSPRNYHTSSHHRSMSSQAASFDNSPFQVLKPSLFKSIIDTWFESQPIGAKAPTPDSFKRWFNNPDKAEAARFDAKLSSLFRPALEVLGPGAIDVQTQKSWKEETDAAADIARSLLGVVTDSNPEHALALVVLLDQMPRNIFREEQAVIYSHYDVLSRSVARAVLSGTRRADYAKGIKDNFARRLWFYMPFMHSEWIQDHDLFSTYLEEAKNDKECNVDEQVADTITRQEDFEERHAIIIRQFGRYPYRNEWLGRETTTEEQQWLHGGGERFSS